MRPKGLSWIALTGLMVLGAPAAEAGVSCKIVPSWCPADEGARGIRSGNAHTGVWVSNKGVGDASTSAATSDAAASTASAAASSGTVAGKTTSVPEPASLLLLGAGVSAVGAAMRRRRKGP
jgi:hypothetical protein